MRAQLEQQGQADVNTFIINGRVIQAVWTEVVNDASLIKQWLEAGADFAVSFFLGCWTDSELNLLHSRCFWQSTPKYMKENLEHGVKIYSRMAKYLLDFANGITNPK